jgi:hypothetical protein
VPIRLLCWLSDILSGPDIRRGNGRKRPLAIQKAGQCDGTGRGTSRFVTSCRRSRRPKRTVLVRPCLLPEPRLVWARSRQPRFQHAKAKPQLSRSCGGAKGLAYFQGTSGLFRPAPHLYDLPVPSMSRRSQWRTKRETSWYRILVTGSARFGRASIVMEKNSRSRIRTY